MERKRDDIEGIDVRYIANLARLELSDNELKLFQSQLGQIVSYVKKINERDLSSVEPTYQVGALRNVFREDKKLESLDNSVVMQNAPEKAEGQFLVPKIIE